MINRAAVYCVVLLSAAIGTAAATSAWSAEKRASVKAVKAAAQPEHERAAKPSGKTETLTCRDGSEDRHARIGVVLRGGEVDSFAYYSKWKPRTCSIYLRRHGDPHSKWSSRGRVTEVKARGGNFVIDHDKTAYRFVFRDVDRERYCGMDGRINGSLIVRKGSQHCEVAGIMEEGVPLGQAWAASQPTPPATAAPQTTTVAQVGQASRRESVYTFQSGVVD
jgi:hypothetical protein